jgi:flagellar basal-body rod modification protein FlgD
MIDPTGSSSAMSGGTAGTTSSSVMGRDDFMNLLLTQLRHQDPMNPLEPYQFASQLASFTSVDQLGQLNDAMGQQLSSLQLATVMSQTSFSASLLGRPILAEGNRVEVPADGKGQVTVDVGDGGGKGVLKVFDASGKEVGSRTFDSLDAGRQTLDLPDDLPEGTCTYSLEVTDPDGGAVSVHTYVSGTVDRVLFENGKIVLKVGGMDVDLEALAEIGSGNANQS